LDEPTSISSSGGVSITKLLRQQPSRPALECLVVLVQFARMQPAGIWTTISTLTTALEPQSRSTQHLRHGIQHAEEAMTFNAVEAKDTLPEKVRIAIVHCRRIESPPSSGVFTLHQ
jgi:hypothetical protein